MAWLAAARALCCKLSKAFTMSRITTWRDLYALYAVVHPAGLLRRFSTPRLYAEGSGDRPERFRLREYSHLGYNDRPWDGKMDVEHSCHWLAVWFCLLASLQLTLGCTCCTPGPVVRPTDTHRDRARETGGWPHCWRMRWLHRWCPEAFPPPPPHTRSFFKEFQLLNYMENYGNIYKRLW